jgi:hypothetical protein
MTSRGFTRGIGQVPSNQSVQTVVEFNRIPEWTREMKRRVNALERSTAREVFQESQVEVPVDTGELRSSGRILPEGPGGGYLIVYTADHAQYVHDGTRYMDGRPFLAGPAQRAASGFYRKLEEIVND